MGRKNEIRKKNFKINDTFLKKKKKKKKKIKKTKKKLRRNRSPKNYKLTSSLSYTGL